MSSEFWSIVQGICALIGAAAIILGAYHFINSRPRTQTRKNQVGRNAVIIAVSTALILLLSIGIYYIPGYFQSRIQNKALPTVALTDTPTLTPTSITRQTTSTAQPIPSTLYQVDFSQGSQGWLNDSSSPQWTYDNTNKVLASDGSMPCCSSLSELETIVLNAPTTFTTGDYTIEARIKVMGTNDNNPYNQAQPPFLGFFFRGYGSNGNGYMAGIIGFEPNNPNTGPLSFILVQEPGTLLTRDDKAHYNLDNQWHTYWLQTRGNTYTFFIDQNQLYTQSLPRYFSPGSKIGIEDYDYSLQIQSLTVYPLCTPYKDCIGS